MKKIILWGLLAMIIAGCSNDEMTEIVEMKYTGIAVTAGLTSNTRINFEQEGDVVYAHWDSDDKITLYADSQGDFDYQVSSIDDVGTTASFSAVEDVLQNTDEVIYATYPATMITDGVATLPITSVWSDTRDMSFAYAVGNVADGKVDLQFKHLYAYLKLTLNAETVSEIDTNEISGLWITNSSGDWISTNSGTYDFNTQTYTFTEGTNCMVIEFEETFVADGDAEKVVYIPIIPLGSGNTINLSVLHEHETGCDTLHIISKDIPESGFEAGKVYTYSPIVPFIKEGNSITLKVAGTLSQAISAEAKDTITSLKISGPLNGDDIRFIREMAGRDVSGNETEGKLVNLDMKEASIVEGGEAYYSGDLTTNNVIGKYMFQGTILKDIVLPQDVTSVLDYAFSACTSLTSITIPEGLTEISVAAFINCSALTSITIPEGVTEIGKSAFNGCSVLTSITIPDGVTSIKEHAFCDCTSLTNITIPNGVTSIEGYAFYNCSSLTSINIPEGVTEIGRTTFLGCSSLTSIIIPNSVTSIGYGAFFNCSSLTSIIIPDRVTSIGEMAFSGCSALTSITIPEGVTEIGRAAFQGCSLTNIDIPEGIKKIEGFVFNSCSSLTSITIPDGVTSIGEYAFNCCSTLTNISIPNSTTSIEERAFFNCYSLVEVTCEATNPPTLGLDCFTKIASSSTLIVPAGYITTYSASDWASYFTTIDDAEDHGSYENGVATVVTAGTLSTLIPEDEKYTITTLKVVGPLNGDDIRFIREMAGRDVNGSYTSGCLVNLDMSGASIVEGGDPYYSGADLYYTLNNRVGDYMFDNTILGQVILPISISSIGEYAFRACLLDSITIPDGVSSIGELAFAGCQSLTSITIPNSVTSIGNSSFVNCFSLTSITIPDNVTSIGEYAFTGCESLTSITVPNTVISIGGGAFKECSSLISINIPEGLTEIPHYAFSDCTSLASITIPSSITSISIYAFSDCTSLAGVTCKATTPPTLGENAFYNISPTAELLVHSGYMDVYVNSEWSPYFALIGEQDF